MSSKNIHTDSALFQTWTQLAKALTELLHPVLEVTLLDGTNLELTTSYNSLGTSHQDELLTDDELLLVHSGAREASAPAMETLKGGRQVKRCVVPVYGDDGALTLVMRARFDASLFLNVQQLISTLTHVDSAKAPAEDSWQKRVDAAIESYLREHRTTLGGATREHKRDLVAALNAQGLFDYKDAANYIADAMGTSRATIYNYLKWATTLKRVHIHQVDAFTDKPFGGNPAGVVLDANELSDDLMRKITREMNLSETSFVLPSSKADFRLRYFTPSGDEVSFCGHSTVGALYMLAHEGRFGIGAAGLYTFEVETACGILTMRVRVDDDSTIRVGFDTPKINLLHSSITHEKAANALGISKNSLNTTLPVMFETTNRDLFVVVKSLNELEKLQCDLKSASKFCKEHDIVAICLLTPETFDIDNHVHVRVFAPAVGIPEDPFTGSVLGGLAAYVHSHSLVKLTDGQIGVEQGHFMQRPGSVQLHMTYDKEKGYHVRTCAQAVHFFSTDIDLTSEDKR